MPKYELVRVDDSIDMSLPIISIVEKNKKGRYYYSVSVKYLGELILTYACKEISYRFNGYPFTRKKEVLKFIESKLNSRQNELAIKFDRWQIKEEDG